MNPDLADREIEPSPTTVSIFKTLAILPSGSFSEELTPDEFGKYLAERYNGDAEKDRNTRHQLRDDLYHDGAHLYMENLVSDIFMDPTVRRLRQKWVKHARYNNVTKRLVNDLATVYSEPAKRIVSSGDDVYQQLLEVVRMDERAIEINRLLNLHRALLVGFRVRQRPTGIREPVIDIATPANVRAIMHPNDNTEVVGWMIRNDYRTARKQTNAPIWTVWTDHESFFLRENLSVIGDSYQVHKLGLCPWVPVALGPSMPGFWPGYEGEDIVAAHLATWFVNILHLKETKSATKQTLLAGDGTTAGRGQSADSEVPIEVPDGTRAQVVDMSMDLAAFASVTDHIIQNTAQNYGMSPGLVTHQGVQSAQARELMRLPLRELRRQQQVPLRRFERQFAIVMARVVEVDAPEFSFKTDGWRIEFAESETPLDPLNELMLFERRRAAGLTNTVEFMREKSPGLSEEDAFDLMRENVNTELTRNMIMRPLQAIQGTMDAAIEAAAAGARSTITEDNPTDASGNPGGVPAKPGAKPATPAPAQQQSAVIVAGNPWRIEQRGGKYLVVKSDTGEVVGTHDTLESAKAQLAALHANVKE